MTSVVSPATSITSPATAIISPAPTIVSPAPGIVSPAGAGFTSGFLDVLGVSAFAAYSLRRLSINYSGKCCNVRRSSDNTTQDIGFTASGNFDVSGFNTFVGGGSGFVAKWYDQSGNGNDLVQATAGSQPLVVLAALNGYPTIRFNGSSTYIQAGPTLTPASTANLTEFAILALQGNGAGRAVATMDNTNDVDWQSGSVLNAAANSGQIGWGGQNNIFPAATNVVLGAYHQFAGWMQQASGTAAYSVDNAAAQSTTGTGAATQTAVIRLGAGESSGSSGSVAVFSQSDLSEVVLFAADETTLRAAAYANQKAYWGTP